MKAFLTSGLLTLTVCAALLAQEQTKDPCAGARSQGELNIGWGKQYKAADARLNQVYHEFMTKLNAEESRQLKTAQLAWLKYRDSNCEFVADQFKGGSMRPMIVAMCLSDVTNARVTELRSQIKDREL